MSDTGYISFMLLLLGSMSAYTVFFSGTVFPTIIVLVFSLFLIISYFLFINGSLYIPQYVVISTLVLFGSYAVTVVYQPAEIHRPIIYIIVLSTSMLLVPQTIDRSVFFVVVRTLSALLVLVGLPAVIAGPYSLFGTTIGFLWEVEMPLLPTQLYIMQSIYVNPNFLMFFLLNGVLISLYLYDIRRTNYSLFLLLVNGCGLFLTQSRSGILIGIFAVLGYLIFRIDISLFRLVVLGGIPLAVSSLFLTILEVGPLTQINLSGRREIWQESISLVIENPIGYGPAKLKDILEMKRGISNSTHSSYIRIFMEAGIIGGVAYVGLIVSTLFHHIRLRLNKKQAISFLLALSASAIMFFETFILGGTGSSSILASICLGYLIKDIANFRASYSPF